MTTLLITSIGSLGGTHILKCLESVRRKMRVIGVNSVAAAEGNFLADVTYLVPPTIDASKFRSRLVEILGIERPDVVINGRDEELGVLAQLATEPALSSVEFLVPPPALVSVFSDKYQTALFAREHSLPFAATALDRDEILQLVARKGFPLLAKPRLGGFNSKSVFLLFGNDHLEVALDADNYVIQEFVSPQTIQQCTDRWKTHAGVPLSWAVSDIRHTAEMVIGREGTVISLSMDVSATEGPYVVSMELIEDPQMRKTAQAYAGVLSKLGHRGPLNVQGKQLPDGTFIPFELNARFTGSSIARTYLGCNQVLEALQHWAGLDVSDIATPKPSLVCRAPLYIPLDPKSVEVLQTSGYWTR